GPMVRSDVGEPVRRRIAGELGDDVPVGSQAVQVREVTGALDRDEVAPGCQDGRLHPSARSGELVELPPGEAVEGTRLRQVESAGEKGGRRPRRDLGGCLWLLADNRLMGPKVGVGADAGEQHGRHQDGHGDVPVPPHGKYWRTSGRICSQWGTTTDWASMVPIS